MNRWVNSFQNHPFQTPWKSIVELSDKIVLQDETVATDVQELARLKKVITYIDQLISASDSELVPQSIWGSFHDQAVQCLDQINQYNNNKNIGHLTNANNNLDNLLTYVRPYVVSEKTAAQAAAKSFKTYSDTVNTQIDLIQSKVQASVNGTQTNKELSDGILREIEQSKQNIQQLEQKLLTGDVNEKSLQEKMQILLGEAQEWNKIIGEFHKRLTSGNEQESAISLQIEEAKNKAISNSKIIEGKIESSEKMIDGLKKFYSDIFGLENAQGELSGGLKLELSKRSKDLDDFKLEQDTAYKTLFDRIEKLLPGATSAGLATAYRELKESFDEPIKNYTKIFYGALFGIVLVGIFTAISKIGFWQIEFIDIMDSTRVFGSLFYKLPILGSLLWLALFASKRRSENQRLQQEYAHKEALAKSYQGFKMQIDALKDEKEVLMNKLLEASIQAVSFNASETLDGKHGDKIPTHEFIDGLLQKLPIQNLCDKVIEKILR